MAYIFILESTMTVSYQPTLLSPDGARKRNQLHRNLVAGQTTKLMCVVYNVDLNTSIPSLQGSKIIRTYVLCVPNCKICHTLRLTNLYIIHYHFVNYMPMMVI